MKKEKLELEIIEKKIRLIELQIKLLEIERPIIIKRVFSLF